MKRICRVFLASAVLATTSFCFAQQQQMPKDDLTPGFKAPEVEKDYIKRVEMVPMRDGVKLYTVIVIPKGAHDAPMVLTRTPYNAAARAERTKGAAKMIELLPLSDEDFVKNGLHPRVPGCAREVWVGGRVSDDAVAAGFGLQPERRG